MQFDKEPLVDSDKDIIEQGKAVFLYPDFDHGTHVEELPDSDYFKYAKLIVNQALANEQFIEQNEHGRESLAFQEVHSIYTYTEVPA